MGLIRTDRHSAIDLEVWGRWARMDAVAARSSRLTRREEKALKVIRLFCASARAYVGVSWGKDSMVVLDLVRRSGVEVPVVYGVVAGRANPDCELVRDAYFERFGRPDYHEIIAPQLHKGGVSAVGDVTRDETCFGLAAARFGPRYISGVRGGESGARSRRMWRWAESSPSACAPLGWWSHGEVYAYLAKYDLPIHPGYAHTLDGALAQDREAIRVAAIGGERGQRFGRHLRDWRYYPEMAEAAGVPKP